MLDEHNIERLIQRLAHDGLCIGKERVGFSMDTYVGVKDVSTSPLGDSSSRPGTVACIAGHCYLMATGVTVQEAIAATDAETIETVATDFLGLTRDQASDLFFDLPEEMALMDVSVEQAIAVLNRLLDTGEVRWLPASPMQQ